MNEQINHILDVGVKVDPEAWTLSDIISKIFEEGGEFSRATQIKAGKIDRDQPENEDYDECADLIITAVDCLARGNGLYEHDCPTSRSIFLLKLAAAIDKKCVKWEKKIPLRAKYATSAID